VPILRWTNIFRAEPVPEYRVTEGEEFEVTDEMKRNFSREGFIIVRLCSSQKNFAICHCVFKSGKMMVTAYRSLEFSTFGCENN